ncbi:tryptophan synthase beta subunit-like PLP-dependent enzyme [Rhizodiscina lignyota]|uniref:threonine synthase n=1 Tax=Rhizodiscina lignyota TaxID=1504668 RepID=A0A9P4IAG0_9PEZI|nr:tryptophan synthase beta subunit-like PLP-dependent enzyme [Rhizodiscina lignyota]
MASHTASQKYLSTRGGSYDLSFEEVVLKGLASDGGLFIPEDIPSLPADWHDKWKDLSFQELAFEIFSLYISPSEIPPQDLRGIIQRSYSTFRTPQVTPIVTLDSKRNIHLLELFHGPTFAFKDVALQFLGNLFEYFLVRRNEGKTGKEREQLTVIGATSGDTGSAAIYGLRGKKDVSVFITFPYGKVSPIQEAQMTTVTDANVHCLAVQGTFDDCQDIVKSLFADASLNANHRLAAVNSINWARILAQITYYFSSYFSLLRQLSNQSPSDSNPQIAFTVPTGNFGDILAGYFAKRMGLPVAKLLIATNSNDILHRFWQSGRYEKHAVPAPQAEGGIKEDGVQAHEEGVKETLSPAMDILVSSNFERLLWFLAHEIHGAQSSDVKEKRRIAGEKVRSWLNDLKSKDGFAVDDALLKAAKRDFASERVNDEQTIETIREVFCTTGTTGANGNYILDPHSAVGIAASVRQPTSAEQHYISLSTAHPAKFSHAVERALKGQDGFSFEQVLPREFDGMLDAEKRVRKIERRQGSEGVKKVIIEEVEKELRNAH